MACIFSLTMVASGEFGNKVLLQVANEKDSLWRLALINEMQVHFPPDNPGFANIPLRGYHFFYTFLLAQMVAIFHFSPTDLYFRFFPLLLAFLWGGNVFIVMNSWSKSRSVSLWAVLLSFFGGSFAYLLPFFGYRGLSLDSAFGILQPAVSLVNPEFSISVIILTAGLFSLFQYLRNKNRYWLIPLILFFGLIAEFKVYAGIIALGGFTLFALFALLQKKFIFVGALVLMLCLFVVTYWRFTGKAGYLTLYPLWPQHEVFKNSFPAFNYSDKIRKYTEYYDFGRIIALEMQIFLIFFFGNLGTRIIGLLFLFFHPQKRSVFFSRFSLIVLTMLAISFFIPMFFIQSIKVFETTQFFHYFLFFSSLFASFGLAYLWQLLHNRLIKIGGIVIFLILTLPSAFSIYTAYIFDQKEKISHEDYQAMKVLKHLGTYDATVLEYPDPELHFQFSTDAVRYWYEHKSTMMVSAFANKKEYVENEDYEFPGIDKEKRFVFLAKLLQFEDPATTSVDRALVQKEIERGLKENKIIFVYAKHPLNNLEQIKNIKKIYHSEGRVIYRVYES